MLVLEENKRAKKMRVRGKHLTLETTVVVFTPPTPVDNNMDGQWLEGGGVKLGSSAKCLHSTTDFAGKCPTFFFEDHLILWEFFPKDRFSQGVQ